MNLIVWVLGYMKYCNFGLSRASRLLRCNDSHWYEFSKEYFAHMEFSDLCICQHTMFTAVNQLFDFHQFQIGRECSGSQWKWTDMWFILLSRRRDSPLAAAMSWLACHIFPARPKAGPVLLFQEMSELSKLTTFNKPFVVAPFKIRKSYVGFQKITHLWDHFQIIRWKSTVFARGCNWYCGLTISSHFLWYLIFAVKILTMPLCICCSVNELL